MILWFADWLEARVEWLRNWHWRRWHRAHPCKGPTFISELWASETISAIACKPYFTKDAMVNIPLGKGATLHIPRFDEMVETKSDPEVAAIV